MLAIRNLCSTDQSKNAYQECVRQRVADELSKVFTPQILGCGDLLVPQVYHFLSHDLDSFEELDGLGVFRALKKLSFAGNESAMECMCNLNIASLSNNRIFDESNRPVPLRIDFVTVSDDGGDYILLRYLRPKHKFGENRPNFEVGFTLWGASLVFCRFVLEYPETFYNKTVLELGSGMGLGGLMVAKFGNAKHVVLSDFHPDVVENCDFNAKLNGVQHSCQSITLDWEQINDVGERFDVVIGTDVICQAKDCDSVCRVLQQYLKPNGCGVFVLGGAESRYGVELFAPQLTASGFKILHQSTVDGSLDDLLLLSQVNLDMVVGKARNYTTFVITTNC